MSKWNQPQYKTLPDINALKWLIQVTPKQEIVYRIGMRKVKHKNKAPTHLIDAVLWV